MMIKITTWNDTLRLNGATKLMVQDHFTNQFNIYKGTMLITLHDFSLTEYGEIYVVENFAEIETKLFEFIMKYIISESVFYCAVYIPNNDIAIDYVIDSSLLSPQQIELLEQDVVTCFKIQNI